MSTPASDSPSTAPADFPARCPKCAAEVPPPPSCLCARCTWSLNDSQAPTPDLVDKWEGVLWVLPAASLLMLLPGFASESGPARIPAVLAWIPLMLWAGLGPRSGMARVVSIGVGGLGAVQTLLPNGSPVVSSGYLMIWILVIAAALAPAHLMQRQTDPAPRLIALGKIFRGWAVLLAVGTAVLVGVLLWPPSSTTAGFASDRAWPLRLLSPFVALDPSGSVDIAISSMRCVALGILALVCWKFGTSQLRRGRLAARLAPAKLRDTKPAGTPAS